jgi:hypothetical protein
MMLAPHARNVVGLAVPMDAGCRGPLIEQIGRDRAAIGGPAQAWLEGNIMKIATLCPDPRTDATRSTRRQPGRDEPHRPIRDPFRCNNPCNHRYLDR